MNVKAAGLTTVGDGKVVGVTNGADMGGNELGVA
jgi:hypothetical protein